MRSVVRRAAVAAGALAAAGLFAAGTVLTAGVASAGTHVAGGMLSAGKTGVHHPAAPGCEGEGDTFFYVTAHGVNYYAGGPNSASSGSTVRLKPSQNGTTHWGLCYFYFNGEWLITNQGLALTSRSSSPGANVTLETAGNHGNGFASQRWNFAGGGTYQNVKTGLFLRVRNNGPIMHQTVTTGKTATAWK
jgi:hypothetical protein